MAERKRVGIHALKDHIESGESAGDTNPPNTSEPSRTKSLSSPHRSKSMTSQSGRIERMYLTLPVTKSAVTCLLQNVDPAVTTVFHGNMRSQELLSETDPGVSSLLKAIEKEGQRDPALGRWIETEEGKRLEIIYGSRRRFVVGRINEKLMEKDGAGLKLKVWVPDASISDADANRLSASENEDREDISAWERAKFYESDYIAHPDLTVEALASLHGLGKGTLSKYLSLAGIDLSVVRLLQSPSLLWVNHGPRFKRLLADVPVDNLTKAVSALGKNSPYLTALDLLGDLTNELQVVKPGADGGASKAADVKSASGVVEGKFHSFARSPGKYRVDFSGLDEARLSKLKAFIESEL